MATVLPTLEKNSDYKLTFKYFLPEGVTKALTDGYMRNIGVSLKGTTLSGSGNNITPASFVKKGGNMDGVSGTWQEYSIEFSTGDNTEFVFGANKLSTLDASGNAYYLLYFDDFTIVEIDPFIKVTFNTNGGSDVATIEGKEGEAFTMPDTPTKDGYIFAGWYTDSALTNSFSGNVIPERDITLYADWINGSYQDFENFTVVTENGKNPGGTDEVAVIEENSQNAYSGADVLKISGDTDTNGRVIVSQTAAEKLSAFASLGDGVNISFKYKLLSGEASFYLRTSTVASNVNALPSYTNDEGKVVYASGYDFKEYEISTVSNSWQTFSNFYSIIDEAELILWETTDDSYIFTSYLTNIPTKYYGADILVRTYAIDSYGNVYYGDECSVSVFDVANAMDNGATADGSEPSEIDITSFAQFVTDDNKQSYLDWCSANNKSTGALFESWYTMQ